MNRFYNRQKEYLDVLGVMEDTNRAARFLKRIVFSLAGFAVFLIGLFSLNFPLFVISNDYEYTWEITGKSFICGIVGEGIALTSFNLVALLLYICLGLGCLALAVEIVANIISAAKSEKPAELILEGRYERTLKTIAGICGTVAALIMMLFEIVYRVFVTSEGKSAFEEFSNNFAFNANPTSSGVLITIGIFFAGTYFLCSGNKMSRFWKKHQGKIYLLGIVVLLFYFWQYGYLHRLFGIDPGTSSFPYPFPKAINSFSKFGGGVKGSYNSVFGSLVSIFFTTSSATLNDSIIYNSVTTVSGMLIGYVIGGIVGYLISIIAASFKKWGVGILTICTILVSFPVVALGPIVNHWFPSNSYVLSLIAKIIVVTILCMAGMAVNSYKGLTVLKPFAQDLMTMCNADTKTQLKELRIPNSLPNVFTALKLNSATALMGSFVCEFYSRSKTYGIGMMFNNYWSTARYQSWAYIIMAVIFGLILYLIVLSVEKKCIAWHPSVRNRK